MSEERLNALIDRCSQLIDVLLMSNTLFRDGEGHYHELFDESDKKSLTEISENLSELRGDK